MLHAIFLIQSSPSSAPLPAPPATNWMDLVLSGAVGAVVSAVLMIIANWRFERKKQDVASRWEQAKMLHGLYTAGIADLMSAYYGSRDDLSTFVLEIQQFTAQRDALAHIAPAPEHVAAIQAAILGWNNLIFSTSQRLNERMRSHRLQARGRLAQLEIYCADENLKRRVSVLFDQFANQINDAGELPVRARQYADAEPEVRDLSTRFAQLAQDELQKIHW